MAFTSESEFKKGLKDSKILVSFPQVDTHPQRAGGLETLTQRYWEAMLSGCLIVGRSPQELIDIMGYNPVIEIDWSEPENQLKSVLEHISSYQPLVDKNYIAAINKASWNSRMTDLAKELKKLEYTF